MKKVQKKLKMNENAKKKKKVVEEEERQKKTPKIERS